MTTMLVTGASGFIGRHTLDLWHEATDVHAVGRWPGPLARGDVTWHRTDLLDARARRSLLAEVRPDTLLHLAWEIPPGRFWDAPENASWADATVALHDAFLGAGGRRFVGAGTCAEYDWSQGRCSETATPTAPRTAYGITKDATRRSIAAAAAEHGSGYAWGRVFWPYGPHERRGRLVPDTTMALLEGRRAECTHGTQERDFIHVQDAAALFVLLAEGHAQGPMNVGSGQAAAVRDVVGHIADLTGRPDLVALGARPSPPDDPPLVVADMGHARRTLGWAPAFTLRSGLADTVHWWKGRTAIATPEEESRCA